jgi:hypothetical protein
MGKQRSGNRVEARGLAGWIDELDWSRADIALFNDWNCVKHAFRGQPDMLPKIPLCCLWLAVKAQRMIGQLAAIAPKCRTAGKDLLLSCAGGCFAGLGIGFFLFLRLGFPATEELAGYMVGLFLVAGLKLGFSLGIIHAPRLYYHSVVSPSRAGSLLRGRRLIRNEALFQLPTYLFCLRIH